MTTHSGTTRGATQHYGGPWQEFRALVAMALIGWAVQIHFRATMDTARDLVRLEREGL